ncbi:C2H2-type zinc finger protein [Aspergillus stella-maris]|uniref:C2H2-type zinc finger protein n=1 Tax=Aspergillus stella-maris TaxID=1810926 RepID=UPI003CCDB60B
MSFQPTMTQPIACPPMEHSPSSFSSYSYSSNSSYSGLSDDSTMSFLDMNMYLGNTYPSSTSTAPSSVSDFPLHGPTSGCGSASPLPFEASSMSPSDIYYDFNPRFVNAPEALPLAPPQIMDVYGPTSYPTLTSASSMAHSSWSPTSMPEPSIFPPLDGIDLGLSPEPAKQPNKPYTCPDCTKSFTRPADLKRHQSTVHYPVFQNCPVPDCSRKDSNGFPRRDHLVEHLRSYHHMDVPKRRAICRAAGAAAGGGGKRVKVSASSY